MHSQLYIREAMKQARANSERMAKVQPDVAKTVDTMAKTETSTYPYRDPVKRRAYQRELMRRRYVEHKR
jgi:hypothetical protein